MSDATAERLMRARWPLIMAAWAVPALLASFETYMFWRLAGQPHPFWRAVVMESPAWVTYALLTPVIFLLGRRLPPQRPHLARNLAVHLLTAFVAGIAYAAIATWASMAFTPSPREITFQKMALSWYLSALPLTTLAYFGILGVGAAITFLGEARRRERDAARLAAQLAEARLGALQMQLHPHFLFNSLNAINVLARDGDTFGVSRMITLLSELLRDVLRTDVTHEVPLSEELAFARRYLAIELVRFEDRLRVIEDIDTDTLELAVPCFVLQPLIENALRHGLAPRAAGGTIEIAARLHNGVLELRVQDDGAGLPSHWSVDGYGIGLSNTVARVRELYGPHGTVSVSQISGDKTCAMIRIPARASNAPEAARRERELARAF